MILTRVVTVLTLCAPAAGVAQGWQKTVEGFRAKAMEERKKLGLDKDVARLKARFPTPEVTFSAASGGGSCVALCPGKTAAVRLAGSLPPKSLVVPASDDVEVLKESLSAKGWEATLRARPQAPPQRVGLVVVTPVSAIRTSTPGVEIACAYAVKVTVEKDTLSFKADFPCGADSIIVPGEWARGGAVVGRASYEVHRGDGTLQLTRAMSAEDAEKSGAAMAEVVSSPTMRAFEARQQELLTKAEACQGAGAAGFQACFQTLQVQLEKLNAERDAYMAQEEKKRLAPSFGCNALSLRLAAGAVSGDGLQCAGNRLDAQVQVSGTYSSP